MSHDARPEVLVIDDDSAVRSLLERGLDPRGYAVRTASSGRAALQQIVDDPPDVVILDVMMPGLDGVEVCRLIRQIDPALPVLMLTARDTDRDEIAGLAAGADDYMPKPFSLDVVDARLRALLRRRSVPAAQVLGYQDLRVDVAAHQVFRGSREVKLTSTEFAVLLVLLQNAGHVLSKEQILNEVWSYEFGGDGNLVEVYVAALRKKLEANGEARLLETVRGVGYVLRAE